MLRLAAIILLSFCFWPLAAQTNFVDSLELGIATSPLDTNRVILLNQIASTLRGRDSDLALTYARQAHMLAQRLQYMKGTGYALETIGTLYLRKGVLSHAFEISAKALKINDSLNNKLLVARLLNTIAIINLKQHHYQPALENLRRACSVSRQLSDFSMLGYSLNNLSSAFLAQGNLDSAFHYVHAGIEVSKRTNDKNVKANAFQVLGDIFLKRGDANKALANYQQCFTEANAINNIFLKITTLFRMGKLHHTRKEPALAIPYFNESINLAKNTEYGDELESAYKFLAESYALLGDLVRAYACQQKFIELHDAISQQYNNEQLSFMQAKFDTEIKQAQIELLVNDTQLKQRRIEGQKMWLYVNIGCLALMLILAFVLYDGYRRIKIANHKLKNRNTEMKERTMQLSNLNITKDKLFSIIGHDLRSPVASLKGLMSIIGNGALSQEEFSGSVSRLRERLDSVYDDLDNLLQWAQSQLNGLQATPERFDLKTLAETKVELFSEIARAKKVTLINNIAAGSMVLADRNHISLVLRNLITNAIKFTAEEGIVRIQCREHDGQFEVSVSDSGVGIGLEDLNRLFNINTHFSKRGTREEKGMGIGLLLTKEFVESNGGSIWVSSELGKGSTFTFTLKGETMNKLLDPVLIG